MPVTIRGLTKQIYVTHHLVHHCGLHRRFDCACHHARVQHLGFITTTVLGIAGSIIGGLIARLFSKPEPGSSFHPAGFILSIIGAIILLFIWAKLAG